MAQATPAVLPLASPLASGGTMPFAVPLPLAPMKARADRIIDIAVCLRPFRAQGPRIEAQRLGSQMVVHNYGHGGSGWSLSWGSARLAVQMVLKAAQTRTGGAGSRHIAVIGCGAIGLTSAIVAQRAGLRVRIFCRDRPPEVASLAASGVWSSSSRICTSEHANPAFVQRWQAITRESHHVFQSMLGLADHPVERTKGYVLSDIGFDKPMPESPGGANEPDYAHLMGDVPELRPRSQALQPHEHPFPVVHVRRYTQMVFNLPAYTRPMNPPFSCRAGHCGSCATRVTVGQVSYAEPTAWMPAEGEVLLTARENRRRRPRETTFGGAVNAQRIAAHSAVCGRAGYQSVQCSDAAGRGILDGPTVPGSAYWPRCG